MKAKKVLAMTLATAMTVGMLAGCGSTGENKESGSQVKIRFKKQLMRLKKKILILR